MYDRTTAQGATFNMLNTVKGVLDNEYRLSNI